MNEFIKQILCTIAGAIKAAVAFIVGYLKSEKEASQARLQQLQQQQQNNYIYSLMYTLAINLYYVLRARNYYFLKPLSASADIRLLTYQEYKKGQFIYIYELTKTTQETVASTILIQMKHDINADIAQAHHYLMSVYGAQAFMLTYPFIYHGITVVGILDTGTAIRIQIVSNYMP